MAGKIRDAETDLAILGEQSPGPWECSHCETREIAEYWIHRAEEAEARVEDLEPLIDIGRQVAIHGHQPDNSPYWRAILDELTDILVGLGAFGDLDKEGEVSADEGNRTQTN